MKVFFALFTCLKQNVWLLFTALGDVSYMLRNLSPHPFCYCLSCQSSYFEFQLIISPVWTPLLCQTLTMGFNLISVLIWSNQHGCDRSWADGSCVWRRKRHQKAEIRWLEMGGGKTISLFKFSRGRMTIRSSHTTNNKKHTRSIHIYLWF